jgi:hypothetical protein
MSDNLLSEMGRRQRERQADVLVGGRCRVYRDTCSTTSCKLCLIAGAFDGFVEAQCAKEYAPCRIHRYDQTDRAVRPKGFSVAPPPVPTPPSVPTALFLCLLGLVGFLAAVRERHHDDGTASAIYASSLRRASR